MTNTNTLYFNGTSWVTLDSNHAVDTGTLVNLQTTDQSSAVNAINEVLQASQILYWMGLN
jgi:hypothetical protein